MITPEDLIKDINYARTIEDKRLMFLYFDLYVEHFVHALYGEIKYKKTLFKSIIDFFYKKRASVASPKTKARTLVKYRFIDKMYLDIILLIFGLRNELVHNLRPDIGMIEQKINQHKPPIEGDKKGVIKNFLDKVSSWDKIQLYAIPTMVHLYQQLKKIRNEKIDYDMQFQLNPTADRIMVVLNKNQEKT